MGVGFLRSSISLSLLVHAFFMVLCAILLTQRSTVIPGKKLTFIELDPIRDRTTQSKDKKKEEDPAYKRQIVQTSKGTETKTPLKDAYLGERNQTVDRETVSKDKAVVMGQSSKKVQPRPVAGNPTSSMKADKKPVPQTAEAPALKSLGLPILPVQRKQASAAPAGPDSPDWSAVNDQSPQHYIQGLKESEQTSLSTREFVFYGYYQRIRERLDRAWVTTLREKLTLYFRNGRRLASDMDHATRVKVILNAGGEVVRVQILGESGVRDLDEAAVRAFNTAGPFPNPPRGIVGPRGEIEIPWEFILRT